MKIQALSPSISAKAESGRDREDAKLREACQDLESVFTGYLLKSMRSTVDTTDLFGSEKEESVFRDMLDDEVAKAASRQKGTGLAEMLYRQLSQLDKIGNPEISLKDSGASTDK